MAGKAPAPENAANAAAFATGWAPPVPTNNVSGIVVDGTNGVVTVSYTAAISAANANTIIFVPTAESAAIPAIAAVIDPVTGLVTTPAVAAVAAGAAVPLAPGVAPLGSIRWTCNTGTLPAKFRPSSCR